MHRAETLNFITSAVFSDSSHYILSWCDRVPLAVLSLGLIHPVVLLTDVLYLQQSTSSQAAKPAGSSPGQQPCCLRVFVVLSLMPWLLLLLLLLFLLLMMMFVFSLWSCSALCEDSAVISSVSIPRIFGSVCVCTVSLKSTLQNLLPKSLSLPLMCGKCCLLAPLSFSLSLSLALSPPRSLFCLVPLWVAATPLLQTQSLASFTCPHPCLLVHIIRAPISFSPLTPSFLHFLSVLRRVFFSLLILSMSLPSSFLPNSVCTHMHL